MIAPKQEGLTSKDVIALAGTFAIFHAALVIAPVGSDLPFRDHRRRSVAAVFRDMGLYRGDRLSRRGRRVVHLASAAYEAKVRRRKRRA
mgnify:CR=1 FL=1